ncbi:MAG: outer membrane beta-barrel protein [Bacteroidales bacterium]|nr:outer membrane beta-barrel protein [Bacteroidales bacterium]
MKRFRYLIFLFAIAKLSYSQDAEIKEITSYPNPSLIFNWAYNSWLEVPEKVDISPLSMGIDLSGMYTILGRQSFIAMAGGIGISVQNYKTNAMLTGYDSTFFSILNKEIIYQKNKFSTVYVELPIEIRIRTRPNPSNRAGIVRKRNVRWSVGFKIGYLIQSYSKYNGDNLSGDSERDVKFKEYKIPNMLPYRYGVYSSLGYGKFSLIAYYALTDLFRNKKGPELRPFSVGISITI